MTRAPCCHKELGHHRTEPGTGSRDDGDLSRQPTGRRCPLLHPNILSCVHPRPHPKARVALRCPAGSAVIPRHKVDGDMVTDQSVEDSEDSSADLWRAGSAMRWAGWPRRGRSSRRFMAISLACVLLTVGSTVGQCRIHAEPRSSQTSSTSHDAAGWPYPDHDSSNSRHAVDSPVTAGNVAQLKTAWSVSVAGGLPTSPDHRRQFRLRRRPGR